MLQCTIKDEAGYGHGREEHIILYIILYHIIYYIMYIYINIFIHVYIYGIHH